MQFVTKQMTIEQRKELFNGYPNSWFSNNHCKKCNKICENTDKKSCIHSDCPKMCSDCFNSWDKTSRCPCCNEEQKIQCPICQDYKCQENLIKSDYCSHSVCHGCFAASFKSMRALVNCPLCRGRFLKDLCPGPNN